MGKLLELVDALERHKVDIACFQETKWKGSSNKEGNGYKIWYSGSPTARNGVGVILKACLKDKVVHVNRCSDRIISLTLVIDGETINVISAYAPQVGLSEVEKKTFWDSLDKVVGEFPTDQRLILGGDLNGHIGATTEGYAGVHGGFGYGVRNEEGRVILDFATAHDLGVVNSYLKKRGHHLITFQSGGRCTKIDYLFVRRGDLRACKDYRVFPRQACSSQHSLLALDILFKSVQRMRFAEGVSRQVEVLATSDADSMWNILASNIKDTANDTLGVAIGSFKTHTPRRESWRLCEEVQSIITVKQARFKELLLCREGNQEERLRAQESESEGREDVVDPSRRPHFDCYYSRISQAEVKTALQKMGRNKAVGPDQINKVVGLDQIPIEAWRSLGDEGIIWLTSLFNKIFTSAKMPEEWRLGEVIPIFKNKGDAQVCSNYRGIKLLSHTMKLWGRVIKREDCKERLWCLRTSSVLCLDDPQYTPY
ncbi:craniofacial development protein 2 [Tanacetum coccineum]|uniref:Craniofacial development protein 2 n=1 Tax=Tanacetum coccineum TaxID=301880 RepID=A0ABQ5AXV0_9ASTR